MALFEFIKDRKRKAVLFFLTGFFSGGILYFLCNDAAADLYEELWQNIKNWMREESPFLSNFLYSLWKMYSGRLLSGRGQTPDFL